MIARLLHDSHQSLMKYEIIINEAQGAMPIEFKRLL